MRFPWLLSIMFGVGSCVVGQSDRVVRLILPSPQVVVNSAAHRLFVPESSPPPLITQGAGTR